jgi:hypothetical protein
MVQSAYKNKMNSGHIQLRLFECKPDTTEKEYQLRVYQQCCREFAFSGWGESVAVRLKC